LKIDKNEGVFIKMNLEKCVPLYVTEAEKENDGKSRKRPPFVLLFPIVNELTIFKGVCVQFCFALRDLVFLPLSALQVIYTKVTKRYIYNLTTLICFSISLFIAHYFGLTLEWFVGVISKQHFYPMRGLYTLSYIMMKHLTKVHDFIHKAIRGAIRDNKSIIPPALLYIFYILFSYITHLFQVCVLVAGFYQSKEGAFINGLVHVQIINYKKFLPKFTDKNQFIQESFYRISMIFGIIYHLKHNTIEQVKALLMHEYGFVLYRFFLVIFTDDFETYKGNIAKSEKSAILELNGEYKGSASKSTFIACSHESIAILITMLYYFGLVKLHIFIIFIAIAALLTIPISILFKLGISSEPSKDKKKKD
jgi:ABC-type multidrug transport system fused ATPase/permease subunit